MNILRKNYQRRKPAVSRNSRKSSEQKNTVGINAACVSSIGMRSSHEDNYLLNGRILDVPTQQNMISVKSVQEQCICSRRVNILAVSDGMGGHNAGEAASRFCVQKLAEVEDAVQECGSLQEVVERIRQKIAQMNVELCQLSHQDSNLSGMGATLVPFVSCESEYAILNIGDSRAYGFHKGDLVQLTKDHTEGQRMLDLGILSRKELENFPARKHLNRYFGYGASGYVLEADVYDLKMKKGILMLCSDGVTDALSERELAAVLSEGQDLSNRCQKIAELASAAPNADNATVILIEL